MIKDLIRDLAYDNIQLSQGLTRAKLIASKLNSDTLKTWLQKEIEGYDYNDSSLPRYRIIPSALFLSVNLPFNNRHTFPVSFDEAPDDDLKEHLQNHRVTEPISLVETTAALNGQALSLPLSPDELVQFGNLFASQIDALNGKIVSGHFQVGRPHYQYVLDVTKQKLIDTLLELDKAFPNLENEFAMTKENKDVAQNIVTTNIYGSNNPVNVAAGHNVHQSNVINLIPEADIQRMKELGVSDEHVEDIKEISRLAHVSQDKPSFSAKAMKWFGAVATSVTSKGLADNIPAIWDYVQHWVK